MAETLTAVVLEHKEWYEARLCKHRDHPAGKPVYRRLPYRWRVTLPCGAVREGTSMACKRCRPAVHVTITVDGDVRHWHDDRFPLLVYWRDDLTLGDLGDLIGRRAWDLVDLNSGFVEDAEVRATVPAFEMRLSFCRGEKGG
jgi:hypothetical protein